MIRLMNIPPLKIGNLLIDPPILQAPMAGFTNYAFRQVVRGYGGVGLHATEMVNAKGFVWLDQQKAVHPDRLWGVREEARPLAVQIWDNEPETLAQVGRRLAHDYHVSVVDINFGCPVKQVTEKAHSGSYLLKHPDRMGAIIERVVAACAPTPVTGCERRRDSPMQLWSLYHGTHSLQLHNHTPVEFNRGATISASDQYTTRPVSP